MTVQQVGNAKLDAAVKQARELNRRQPWVANSTKVVRLFVVGRDRDLSKPMNMKDFSRSPGRTDVFVVTNPDGSLKPMTWLGDRFVDHKTAHHDHLGTVVILDNIDREQIEWQCDVPFRVANIKKKMGYEDVFQSFNEPDYPFMTSLQDLKNLTGDKDQPIRSGPTRLDGAQPGAWGQLYKADFELLIGGEWKPFDPDFYCGAP